MAEKMNKNLVEGSLQIIQCWIIKIFLD